MDLPTHTKTEVQSKSHLGQVANECENYLSDKWASLQAGARVTGAVAEGACDELKDHPIKLLGYAAAGAVAGAAVACVAPEVAIAAGAYGAIIVGFELSEDIPKWCHEAVVVGNKERVSKSNYDSAYKGLESLGANGLDFFAAQLGAGATSFAARIDLRSMRASLGQMDNGILPTAGGLFSAEFSKLDSITNPATEKALYTGVTSVTVGATIGRKAFEKSVMDWTK